VLAGRAPDPAAHDLTWAHANPAAPDPTVAARASLRRMLRYLRIVTIAALLTTAGACGSGSAPPLSDDTYQRLMDYGVDPALVYVVDVPGFTLLEQSAGVIGDSDYGANYRRDDGALLELNVSKRQVTSCPTDPIFVHLGGEQDDVTDCEADSHGWYRTGLKRHEYVVMNDAAQLRLSAPRDAVDRATLTKVLLGATHQDGSQFSPTPPPTAPISRGDIPRHGDGAPIDPTGPGG
jgi:hypothetical protein